MGYQLINIGPTGTGVPWCWCIEVVIRECVEDGVICGSFLGWKDIEPQFRPKTLDRFIVNSIDVWAGEERQESSDERRKRIVAKVMENLST